MSAEVPRGLFPCWGCQRPWPSRLCPDCTEELIENYAVVLEPTYDRTKMHEWEEVQEILARLWGKQWDFRHPAFPV